jgi:hypothetical protein
MATSATAADPDGLAETNSLVYGWNFSPAPPTPLTPSNTVATPTFDPGSTPADYVVTLTVADTWGATASASFTLHVVNTPPVVDPLATTAQWDRNNGTLSVQMSAYDENNDPLACTWAVCRAGTAICLPPPAAPAGFQALKATPKALSAAFPTGLAGTDEGPWDVTLTCSDGPLSTTGTTTVTVTNSPPAITVPATRTFNLGVDAAGTPTDAIQATANDLNGDSIASWTWIATSVPPTSAVTTATLTGANTDTVSFKPDKLGDYTFTITVCDPEARNAPYVDRVGGCATRAVTATVYPYVRSLAHSATDAAFYRAASTARLVIVAPDSTAGALWDYDLVAGTAPVKTSLPGAPNAVSLTPAFGTAIVADDVNVYKVTLAATATAPTTWIAPFSVGDVIAISGSDAFAFPKTNAGTTYYQRVNLSNGTFSSAYRYGTWGTYVTGSTDNWFVADVAGYNLYRMSLNGQNLITDASRSGFTGGMLWSSGSGAHVFAADGTIYPVPATPVALTPLSPTLGLTGIRSVDTSPTETVVLATPASGSYVARYGASFSSATMVQDALPHWGNLGNDRTLQPLFAFVSYDAKTAYVVVTVSSGTPPEYGLYTYALP